MKNDAVLKLNQKPHTPFGVVSFSLAIAGLILVIVTIVMTASPNPLSERQVIIVGSLEMISAMLTLGGIGIGVIGETAKEMEKVFAHVGLILHFLLLIYHGFVVYFGF